MGGVSDHSDPRVEGITPADYRKQVTPLIAAYSEGLIVLDDLINSGQSPDEGPARSNWKVESATAMEVLWRASEQLRKLTPVPPEYALAADLWSRLETTTKGLVMSLSRWSDETNPETLKPVIDHSAELSRLAKQVDELFPERKVD